MGNDCGYNQMGNFNNESIELEKFYVYRSLHSDNSWGTVVFGSDVCKLPNVSFGMKVFAKNEIEAVSKAKEAYDRIHGLDMSKENIRKFSSAALRALIVSPSISDPEEISQKALEYAIQMNQKFREHFGEIEKKRKIKPSPLSEEELEPLDDEDE